MVGLTSFPYLLAWARTPPGQHYTWILPPYPEDSFGYMSWAQQAAHGHWLFRLKYTALPHQPFLFHPLFLLCGWLAALLSTAPGPVFWFVKGAGVVLFFHVLYRYLDYLGLNRRQFVVACLLIGLSSGIGGILSYIGVTGPAPNAPADLWMPEISTFTSLLWNPLFPFSQALMLLSIFLVDRGTAQRQSCDLWGAGLAAGVMTLLHPYSAPLLFVLATGIILIRLRSHAVPSLWRYFAGALPIAIYIAALSKFNPILSRHSSLGQMSSPSLLFLATGLGLPLLVALAGVAFFRARIVRQVWVLLLWSGLAVVFCYLPFWFQRKLIFGAHIPLSIIAAVTFEFIVNRWRSATGPLVFIIAAALLLPLLAFTPVYLLLTQWHDISTNKGDAYYISDDVREGLKFLRQKTDPKEVVLATRQTSRIIPALAGNTVLWGHWAMAVDSKQRQEAMADSIGVGSYLSDAERTHLFWSNGIQLIFADGELKQFIEQHPFIWGPILKDTRTVFQNGSVVIYQHWE